MTRKKFPGFWTLSAALLFLRFPVFADMPNMAGMSMTNPAPTNAASVSSNQSTVHATDTGETSALDAAINAASKELGQESQKCQKNPKVCAKGTISKEIAGFICNHNFDSRCATSKNETIRLAAAIATDISKIADSKEQSHMAELSVVIDDKNGNSQLVQACTNGESPAHKCQGWTGSGSGELDTWLTGFLTSAMGNAHTVLWSDLNATKASIDKNSAPNSNGTHVPGSTLDINAHAAAISKSFNWKDLYVDGAVTQWVVTDPKTNAGRQISIRMYTTRDPNPPHGLTQQVGVFDYTKPGGPNEPSYIYGRRLNGNDTDRSFSLDPNGPTFHLTIKGGDITFSSEENSKSQIHTTVAALTTLRQNQVQARGYDEKIGDQTFKVIGQGGANGTLLFFPTDKNGQVTSALPYAIAAVNEVGPDGFVHNLKSAPYETALGSFPTGTSGADQFYYMKISKSPDGSEYFEPMVCDDADAEKAGEKCDFPPPPPDKNANGDQTNNSGSSGTSEGGGAYTNCTGPTAKTWSGQTFFPTGTEFDVCFNGNHGLISVPGIPQSFEVTGSDLVIKTAIPDQDQSDAISAEYDTLYKLDTWDYHGNCTDIGGSQPCHVTTPDGNVVLTHERDYSISKESLSKLTGQSSADKIAHIIIQYKLQGQTAGMELIENKIMAVTPKDANFAWKAYLKITDQTKSPYASAITQFIDTKLRTKDAKSTSQSITISPLVASEVKSTDSEETIVAGFNGEKLTVGDLIGQTTSPVKPQKSKKSRK